MSPHVRRVVYHPRTKGALTHTTVVGITVTLVGALHELLPGVPDLVLFIGGLIVAMFGFAGLYFTVNNEPPPGEGEGDEQEEEPP